MNWGFICLLTRKWMNNYELIIKLRAWMKFKRLDYLIWNEWITSFKSWDLTYYMILDLMPRLGRHKSKYHVYNRVGETPKGSPLLLNILIYFIHTFLNGVWIQKSIVWYKLFNIVHCSFTIFQTLYSHHHFVLMFFSLIMM